MVRKFFTILATVGLIAAPTGATIAREAAPLSDENALGGIGTGQGVVFFLAGIAIIALAVVLLPEDQPASP